MTVDTNVEGSMLPLPDPDGTYFFRVEVGKVPPTEGGKEKIMGRFEYPELDYPNLVAVERQFVEGFMMRMADAGEGIVALMGGPTSSQFSEAMKRVAEAGGEAV